MNLSDKVSTSFNHALTGGKFRIGISQKAINLYLKYLWCNEKISTPPHCPFDYQIISILPLHNNISWTKMDSIDEYEQLVAAAKVAAKGVPIAEWELNIYNNIINN